MARKNRRKRSGRKKDGNRGIILMSLVGIMIVGTVAGGFLIGLPKSNRSNAPLVTLPPQTPVAVPAQLITLRHNPVDGGAVSVNDSSIKIDNNHELAGKTIVFNITLLNLTKGNGTRGWVEEGDTVEVDYTGYLENGSVFDTSIGRVPLVFQAGDGRMIKGFDNGVRNMTVNVTRNIILPPEDAYGPYDPDKVQIIPIIQEIPKHMVVNFPVNFQLTSDRYMKMFGKLPTAGAVVHVDELGLNATVLLISGYNVTMRTLISPGDIYPFPGLPWNTTVRWVAENQIEIELMAVPNTTVQFQDLPWNTTVLSVG